MLPSTTPRPLLIPTRLADSRAWMGPDLRWRLLPFGAVAATAWLATGRPCWLGISTGRLGVQLAFGLAGAAVLFGAGAALQLLLGLRRGTLRVPASVADLALQTGYYALN